MKAVLISIRPEWCAKIASGEKTIEVRKTRPEIKTPFKCYIYCSKRGALIYCRPSQKFGNGKVIGEYICDRIERYALMGTNRRDIAYRRLDAHEFAHDIDLGTTCLSAEDLRAYGAGKSLYGWHITQLKIYDKPMDILAFGRPCGRKIKDGLFPCHEYECNAADDDLCEAVITRPPQSWCYVEELHD